MAVDHLLGDDPGLEDPFTFLVSAAIVLVVAAVLFGHVVPRAHDPRRTGFIFAIVSVLSLPFIWIGVPFAVAPAAIALGLKGEGRLATAAMVIADAVLLAATAAYVAQAIEKLG
jgi:hypothetical protein